MLTISIFGGPVIAFCPVIIRDILHGGPEQFGSALTSFGIGGLVGALILSQFDVSNRGKRIVPFFAFVYGLIVVAISLNRSLFGLEVLLVLCAFLTIVNTTISSRLQFHTPNHIRGRVSSLFSLSMRGGLAIGNLIAGFVIHGIGISGCLLLNGCLIMIVQIYRHFKSGGPLFEGLAQPAELPQQ